MEKIKMTTPLVEMDGDEMTRILWKMIKDELILPFVDLKTEYYELSKLWTLKDSSMRTEEMMLDELLPKIVDNYKMRRVEILCREADEKILEFQNAGDMERLVEWIKKKNAMIKVRSRINEKLKRTI